VKEELDTIILQEGEAALLELNLANVHPDLVKLLGRLRYRTSYGQNCLHHSKEVAFLAGVMAGELKTNVHVAKRAGLFHDIGKAIDREMDGTHLQIGIDLLRKYGETEEVVHAMACHHGDYDPETVEAVLVTAADALSAARPGARREILETYVKRLKQLEEIAGSFKGVQKTFAIQAGREIRIIVDSEKISDEESIWLSRDIARRLEAELTYPGQIKVTVIRETRAIEFAK
jgi:ribonucrease Y